MPEPPQPLTGTGRVGRTPPYRQHRQNGEKQMTEKPSYERRRVLMRLAVVHKRECGAFLRRSIVKVE